MNTWCEIVEIESKFNPNDVRINMAESAVTIK